jgi:hypothetical protein
VEEKTVSLANYEKTDDDEILDSHELGSFLINMQQVVPKLSIFEEVPDLNGFIARTFVGKLFELGINDNQAENKIQNLLNDKSIYFWGENAHWNLWYRIALLSFLGEYGTDTLHEVLIIKDNALLVPLINEHSGIEGFALVTK